MAARRQPPPTLTPMRAAVMREWELPSTTCPNPSPQSGQALTRVLACGICGSDLHLLQHGEESAGARATSSPRRTRPTRSARCPSRPDQPTSWATSSAARSSSSGPGARTWPRATSSSRMPVAFDAAGVHAIGFSNRYPGGYAELMVLNDLLAMKVPNGLRAAAGGADRAARRRRARGGQERHPQRRRRDRARAAARSGWP